MLEIIDSLYGKISLNLDVDVIQVPELQRLRSIRLCNVNSPYITGGDGLNRFEHAIGTAYVAQEVIKNYDVDSLNKKAFVLAALYHDIVTASFGHSLEYLFESVTGDEYEHSNIWMMFLSGKTIQTSRPIYYGQKFSLNTVVEHKTIEKISNILSNSSELSELLAAEIDVDNIDNVYRFAYHIGIPFDRQVPMELSKSLKYRNGALLANDGVVEHLQNWFTVREKLYVHLLENIGEFSAKSLLERAFIEAIKEGVISIDDWILTDSQILNLIYEKGNNVAKDCIRALMTMKFPKNYKVVECNDYKKIDEYLQKRKINIIDQVFGDKVFLHFIRDVQKTRRVLKVYNEEKSEMINVGQPKDRYLVGFFSNNKSKLGSSLEYVENEIGVSFSGVRGRNDTQKQRTLF